VGFGKSRTKAFFKSRQQTCIGTDSDNTSLAKTCTNAFFLLTNGAKMFGRLAT